MKMVLFIRREGFESGSISSHGSKIAIVKPINHFLFLLDARPALARFPSG